MKVLCISAAFAFGCFCATAQQTFVKGYVITDKGDTLRGEIRLNPKKEHEAYTKVFLKDLSGVQKNYKPEKTKGYGYDNKRFVPVTADGEARFFEVIVSGPISLYKTIGEVMRMNESVFEAEYFVARQDDKEPVIVKESKFKKQITELMKDNPEIAATYAEEKKFDLEKATDLINRYNAWKSGK
jgi:hypothetical protein